MKRLGCACHWLCLALPANLTSILTSFWCGLSLDRTDLQPNVPGLPAVLWEDIGGLPEVKQRLKHAVQWPLEHATSFERLGLSPPRGVLLHGPPGVSWLALLAVAWPVAACC